MKWKRMEAIDLASEMRLMKEWYSNYDGNDKEIEKSQTRDCSVQKYGRWEVGTENECGGSSRSRERLGCGKNDVINEPLVQRV